MKAAEIYALVAVQLAASLVLTYLKFRNPHYALENAYRLSNPGDVSHLVQSHDKP